MINIYYLDYCPYSLIALKVLDKYKINHYKIESSNNKEQRKLFHPTFPQIYWNNSLIGGNDNFSKIISTLQKNKEPHKPKEWSKKEWYKFLINIAEKI